MKKGTLLIFLACLFTTGYSQYLPGERRVTRNDLPDLFEQLKKSSPGIKKTTVLLNIGYGYLYKSGEAQEDLDTAMQYARQVAELGRQMKSAFFQQESLLLTSMIHTEQKNYAAAERLFSVMDDSIRLKALLVLTMFNLNSAHTTPQPRLWIDTAAHYAKQGLKLSYRTRLLPGLMAQVLEQVAIRYKDLHAVDLSEMYFFQVMKYSDSLGGLSAVREYSFLCNLYIGEGNIPKAREYGIQAEKAINSRSSDQDVARLYLALGNLSSLENKPEQTVHYYGRLLETPHRYNANVWMYGVLDSYCGSLQKLKRYAEVLPYVQKFQQRFPAQTDYDKSFYHTTLGSYYMETKQYGPAETNYLEAIRYANAVHFRTGPIYYGLGLVYYRSKAYEKAIVALKTSEKETTAQSAAFLASIYSYISLTESALGNHESAYQYLFKSKTLTDSIYTSGKTRLAGELEAQYKTRLKEDTLRAREESIRTLNYEADKMRQAALLKDAELQQAALLSQKDKIALDALALRAENAEVIARNAEVIKRNYKLQQAAIEQAEAKKKIIYVVMALLFVIVGLLCWLFWSKQKSNKVITDQNGQLQELVKDKIWLLREMHHRVKNNLHIIDNLLDFQSAYLQGDALDAIRDSQSRIFSMSLIHQKLYQTEDAQTVDMTSYIPELVDYLQESFNMYQAVDVRMDIDPAVFNVGEAVPLGIIINEAVTNAMKHAFAEGQPGRIDISLKVNGVHAYDLVIADNGKGLKPEFDVDKATSLGFQLIKGLAKQLQAQLHITHANGLQITIAQIVANRTGR